MKKLMVAAAAALTATIGFSVESSNIVGYKTFTLSKEYSLIGVCFDGISTSGMTLNEIAPYSAGNGMTKAFALADADNILVMGAELLPLERAVWQG